MTDNQSQPPMIEVRITFQRIQTFLTAVPRLRDMIGANVQLGEVIRRELTELAKAAQAGVAPEQRVDTAFFTQYPDDPLAGVQDDIDRDDPYRLLSEYGVIARDGGHFAAVFQTSELADAFTVKVRNLLDQELRGLPYEISHKLLGDDPQNSNNQDKEKKNSDNPAPAYAESLLDLSVFQVCEESGNGPATQYEPKKQKWISTLVKDRRDAAKDFFPQNRGQRVNPKTHDIVGLLYPTFPLMDMTPAPDFEALSDDGRQYLAVIHADGNGMGNRGWAYRHSPEGQQLTRPLEQALHEERLYHSMRVAVRKAVVEALANTFILDQADQSNRYRPYQLLMLGGDDLLLICQARYALPFVQHYAQALTGHPLHDGQLLSIGAGVVLASHNIPFHHLHQLAEALADSAKRLFRQRSTENLSVVDWLICTQAWADNPVEVRRRAALRHYTVNGQREILALTGKPCRVLGSNLDSLEGLLKAADAIRASQQPQETEGQRAARSQLRFLSEALTLGRYQSDLLYREIPLETRSAITPYLPSEKTLWERIGQIDANSPQCWLTRLGDLVEILEIPRLGRGN